MRGVFCPLGMARLPPSPPEGSTAVRLSRSFALGWRNDVNSADRRVSLRRNAHPGVSLLKTSNHDHSSLKLKTPLNSQTTIVSPSQGEAPAEPPCSSTAVRLSRSFALPMLPAKLLPDRVTRGDPRASIRRAVGGSPRVLLFSVARAFQPEFCPSNNPAPAVAAHRRT